MIGRYMYDARDECYSSVLNIQDNCERINKYFKQNYRKKYTN